MAVRNGTKRDRDRDRDKDRDRDRDRDRDIDIDIDKGRKRGRRVACAVIPVPTLISVVSFTHFSPSNRNRVCARDQRLETPSLGSRLDTATRLPPKP